MAQRSALLSPQQERISARLKKKRVIVLSGPTGSGKTKLSLLLAEALGGEIISADSMQVYKNLDIGTAKPSLEERALIPHHLIDICDLTESFNAAKFYQQSHSAIQEILVRDRAPIVVGGTGFYLRSLLYGPPEGPVSVPEVRSQLEKQMQELGPEILYERLQMLDPDYAATVTEHDRHKIIRALEIMALSEQKVSDFPKSSDGKEPEYDFRCWFIYYPRERLYSRIDQRCEEMIHQGFLDEVRAMLPKGLKEHCSASQAIGYRQAIGYLESSQTKEDFEQFVVQFKRASRQYAKRQFTWFRKESLFRWLNVEEFDNERLKETILQDYEQGI